MLPGKITRSKDRVIGISCRIQRLTRPREIVGKLVGAIPPGCQRPGLPGEVSGRGEPGSLLAPTVHDIQGEAIPQVLRAKRVFSSAALDKLPGLPEDNILWAHHQPAATVGLHVQSLARAQE